VKVRRILHALLPWPPREERRQAISRARRDRIAAERQADHAKDVEERLRAAVMDNHLAQAIAWHLRGGDS